MFVQPCIIQTIYVTDEHTIRISKMTLASVYLQKVTKIETEGKTQNDRNEVID